MMTGMTKAKIAVSLPEEVVAHVRRAVAAGQAESVSAYVAEALVEKAQRAGLDAILDQMLEETGGPLTDEEIEWADRVLGR